MHHLTPTPPATTATITSSTTALPARDRFDWYTDMVSQSLAPITLTSPHAPDFDATATTVDLGGQPQVMSFSLPSHTAVRTPRHIRRGDPETYQLCLLTERPIRVEQLRTDTLVRTGDFVLFDTSHPLRTRFTDDQGRGRTIMLRVPKSAFPLPAHTADRLLAQRLSPTGVSGTLLTQYLRTLIERAADLAPAESHRLGTIALDLAAAFLAEYADAAPLLPAETRRRELLARINAFIDANLADPALTPAHIAAHHHISLRTLHQLFRTEPETVAATIRRRRLERCRADLADPRLRGRPIGALAARWGFLAPPEFSRVFRAAYGLTPSDFRRQATGRATSARDHN
ncbi:helix-turn-helix domain-containing protein [Streptomyces sp. MUM 203J]|uniref:AraC-like ligand-binding domain-containing protein n=1 Tax=Streptomyces sp. MUM 203J TaxID=2791990 RepID=UPI001F03828F|nr:helix-turn-helix domain-containing protein [Streptomyces sp. MUM 203J]MCH0538502.1 helix-turn-helix domain-containing protein [Streptomyces sp. MUM 203J]